MLRTLLRFGQMAFVTWDLEGHVFPTPEWKTKKIHCFLIQWTYSLTCSRQRSTFHNVSPKQQQFHCSGGGGSEGSWLELHIVLEWSSRVGAGVCTTGRQPKWHITRWVLKSWNVIFYMFTVVLQPFNFYLNQNFVIVYCCFQLFLA